MQNLVSLVFFLKQQERAKKWLKLKESGKTPIGVLRRLRVKRQIKTPQGVPKEGSFLSCVVRKNRLALMSVLCLNLSVTFPKRRFW